MAAKIEKKSKNDDMNTVYMSVVALIALVAIVGVAAMVLGIRSVSRVSSDASLSENQIGYGLRVIPSKLPAVEGEGCNSDSDCDGYYLYCEGPAKGGKKGSCVFVHGTDAS